MVNLFRTIRAIVAGINTQLPGNSFLFQRNAFIIIGMWPSLNNWNDRQHLLTKNSRFYRIYSSFLLVGFLYASIVFQVVNIFFVTNIGDFAELACLFATQFVGAFKVQRFNANYRKIRELLEILNDIELRPKNEVEKKFVRTAIQRTFYMNLVLFLLCSATLVQWTILSAMTRTLIFDARYTPDRTITLKFVIVFGYQAVSAVVNMVANTTLDIFIVGLITHINAQVQRLGHRLTLITSYAEMVECIHVHQKLLSLIPKVEHLFGASMFFQICISVVVFCMTGFVLVTEGFDDVFMLFRNIIYLCAMIFQIATYCWAGNDLIFTSDSLATQAFHSNFVDLDAKTKKLLLLFMRRSISNMKIRAKVAFAFDLSLPTLLLVLKSSYTYFALLQQMTSDK